MTPFIYTYPNIGSFQQRGGLKERNNKLNEINKIKNTLDFQVVEVPADLIKNCAEENKTGLSIGSFLDSNTVPHLYSNDQSTAKINYILHTEPVFSRKGCNGTLTTHLKWYDKNWINSFISHITSIIDFLGIAPYAIEIHPGYGLRKKNTFENLSLAIERLYNEMIDRYNQGSLIFIENRTGQQIKSGTDLKEFWNYFNKRYPDLVQDIGIILDIQQLFSVTRHKFEEEFLRIPKDSLYGLHIHIKHQPPAEEDEIPWKFVSQEIESMKKERTLHILPELFHLINVIKNTIFPKIL